MPDRIHSADGLWVNDADDSEPGVVHSEMTEKNEVGLFLKADADWRGSGRPRMTFYLDPLAAQRLADQIATAAAEALRG